MKVGHGRSSRFRYVGPPQYFYPTFTSSRRLLKRRWRQYEDHALWLYLRSIAIREAGHARNRYKLKWRPNLAAFIRYRRLEVVRELQKRGHSVDSVLLGHHIPSGLGRKKFQRLCPIMHAQISSKKIEIRRSTLHAP